MALVVCCPCGNPLDCDDLDIVVSLTCPKCGRDILIELEGEDSIVRRGVLTVMEGPHWVGERFLVPVDADLTIGTSAGNWLSLDSESMGDQHCRLQLAPDGRLLVEDLRAESGTWIQEQRILKGRLQPLQSLRIGEFRFRFDIVSIDGKAQPADSAAPTGESTRPLPAIERVSGYETPGLWLVHNRFLVARILMTAAAWLMGLYHVLYFPQNPKETWAWLPPCLLGLGVALALQTSGRRVTLLHQHRKFIALGVLGVLTVMDACWGFLGPAIAALLLLAALPLLIIRFPAQWQAVFAAVLGLVSTTILTVQVLQKAIPYLSQMSFQ